MKTTANRKLALALALGITGYAGYRVLGPRNSPDDPGLVQDRVWLEKKPEKPTELVHALFVSRRGVTVFQKASSYDFRFELASHKRDGEKLAFVFPQTSRKAELSFAVKACSDRPPFDLCLEISDNPWGGPKKYYGMKEQDDESKQLGEEARALRAQAGE